MVYISALRRLRRGGGALAFRGWLGAAAREPQRQVRRVARLSPLPCLALLSCSQQQRSAPSTLPLPSIHPCSSARWLWSVGGWVSPLSRPAASDAAAAAAIPRS